MKKQTTVVDYLNNLSQERQNEIRDFVKEIRMNDILKHKLKKFVKTQGYTLNVTKFNQLGDKNG